MQQTKEGAGREEGGGEEGGREPLRGQVYGGKKRKAEGEEIQWNTSPCDN